MQESIQQRLRDLQEEFTKGQTMLTDLETQQSQLRESLLRISGAIQVLEELIEAENNQGTDSNITHLETTAAGELSKTVNSSPGL